MIFRTYLSFKSAGEENLFSNLRVVLVGSGIAVRRTTNVNFYGQLFE